MRTLLHPRLRSLLRIASRRQSSSSSSAAIAVHGESSRRQADASQEQSNSIPHPLHHQGHSSPGEKTIGRTTITTTASSKNGFISSESPASLSPPSPVTADNALHLAREGQIAEAFEILKQLYVETERERAQREGGGVKVNAPLSAKPVVAIVEFCYDHRDCTGLIPFLEGPGARLRQRHLFHRSLLAAGKAEDADTALSIMRIMGERDVKIEFFVYSKVMSLCCRVKRYEEGLKIFQVMRSKGLPVNEGDYLCAITAFAERKDANQAFALLGQMKCEGLTKYTWLHFANVIDACLSASHFSHAADAMKKAQAAGFRVSRARIEETVVMCAKAGDMQTGSRIMSLLLEGHVSFRQKLAKETGLDSSDLDVLFSATPLRAKQRREYIKTMVNKGEWKKSLTSIQEESDHSGAAAYEDYKALIHQLALKRMAREANRVYWTMIEQGLGTNDINTLNTVLEAHSKADFWQLSAWQILRQAVTRLKLKPDLRTYSIMLSACVKGSDGAMAMRLLSMAQEDDVDLPEHLLGMVMSACAKARDTKNARKVMEKMEVKGYDVLPTCLMDLAEAEVSLSGQGADDLLYLMASRGFSSSIASFVAAGYPQRALELYHALPQDSHANHHEVCPSDFKAALRAAASLGDVESAANVLLDMDTAGIEIDSEALGLAGTALKPRLQRRPGGEEEKEEAGDDKKEREVAAGRGGGSGLQTILRLAKGKKLGLGHRVVSYLVEHGYEAEACQIMEEWLPSRDAERSTAAYCTGMIAYGVLGKWPIVHYLYDEANVLQPTEGGSTIKAVLFRNLVHASSDDAILEDSFLLPAYRQLLNGGMFTPWMSARKLDFHRYPFNLAKLAMRVVLDDIYHEVPGCHDVDQDLWMMTGRGKHSSSYASSASSSSSSASSSVGVLHYRLAKWLHGLGLHSDPDDPAVQAFFQQNARPGHLRIRSMEIKKYMMRRRREETKGGRGGEQNGRSSKYLEHTRKSTQSIGMV